MGAGALLASPSENLPTPPVGQLIKHYVLALL